MANVTIAGGTTNLPIASTIDGAADYLPIYTASALATQAINRNTLLGLASAPLGLSDTQSPTNKTFDNTNTLTIKDGNLTLQNSASTTKQARFSAASITAGQTRTFTLPDLSDTVVTLTATQTLTNKTLTSPTITSPTITNATISADMITGFSSSSTGTIYGISVAGAQITTVNSIGTGTIVQNGVAASQLAANAIKLGYSQITGAITTTSTTPVQATGLTTTVTVPAGGRSVKITAYALIHSDTNTKSAAITLWDGTVGSGTQLNKSTDVISNALNDKTYICVAVVTPAAGSKTYNVGWVSDPGGGITATMAASSTAPAFILVEAI